MPAYDETRDVPYSPEQMFSVVADVERYPEFVPGCAALRVRTREHDTAGDTLTAEMVVAYHGLRERYVSRVHMDRGAWTISATHVEGPFDHLNTQWRFTKSDGGCRIAFHIDFAFRNRLLALLAERAFDRMARRMAEAFVERAAAIYGSQQLS